MLEGLAIDTGASPDAYRIQLAARYEFGDPLPGYPGYTLRLEEAQRVHVDEAKTPRRTDKAATLCDDHTTTDRTRTVAVAYPT
jgi:hypothetical protein